MKTTSRELQAFVSSGLRGHSEEFISMGSAILRTVFVVVVALGVIISPGAESSAGAMELVVPTEPVAQGDVVRVGLKGVRPECRVQGFWQGEPLGFFCVAGDEYASLVGIDLRLIPGTYPLRLRVITPGKQDMILEESMEVAAKDYGVERLRLPEEMVTLDAATLKRVRQEQLRFNRLWDKHSPERYWRGGFILPVGGKLIAPFGRRRIINGEPRSPHSGVDLRARTGEPVLAANHGRVVLVGKFFFAGLAVVVDHGLGLYTMYFHLSRANVARGDVVKQGMSLGLAGSSGRSTGPHLHWGVRLNNARIDPLSLLQKTAG